MNSDFFTPEQIAAEAGISLRTVLRDIHEHKRRVLRSYLSDNRRVVLAHDAKAYIAKRRAIREAADALKARA